MYCIFKYLFTGSNRPSCEYQNSYPPSAGGYTPSPRPSAASSMGLPGGGSGSVRPYISPGTGGGSRLGGYSVPGETSVGVRGNYTSGAETSGGVRGNYTPVPADATSPNYPGAQRYFYHRFFKAYLYYD